ncbi:glycosyltransferase family 4 protein [Vibrio owensii]|uniref:glycosyltransferase family 4 protein n=1 Tax=Vibrio owensii TaxID=696485 RepID=UPI003D9FFC2C
MKALVFFGVNNPLEYKRGVENVILSQIDAVRSEFDKIYYIHLGNSNDKYVWGDINCYTVKKNFRTSFSLFFLLKKIKDSNENVTIHSHSTLTSFLSFYQTDILTIHDGLYYLRKSINHPLSFLHYLVEKFVYRRCSLVHFISEYTKQKSLFSTGKFVVIGNTTPLEKISKEMNISSYDRLFDEKKFNIFSVRGIQQRTNIDLLIELAEFFKLHEILLHGRTVHITISGKGPLLEHYREKIVNKGLNNITLLGFVDDSEVVKRYCDCDLVLVPALHSEGFGLPIIEAYLFNKTALASNVCAMPEVIFDNKHLFSNELSDLVRVIQDFCNGQEKQLDKFYKEKYSNKIYAERMKRMYRGVYEK